MIHKTKQNNDWVDGKSKSVWAKFQTIVKSRHSSDMSGTQGVGEGNEDARIENQEEDEEEDEDDAFMAIASALPKEVIDKAWLEAVGGPIKGRVYGLGSESSSVVQGGGPTFHAPTGSSSASSVPSQCVFETPSFEEAVNRAVEQKLTDMQATFQEELQALKTTIQEMRERQRGEANRDGQ
ncbi:PREDICTED: uncharacterized protein LOC105966734 [Erythranthe guttata]|uniref:uncharacterized protein LOC105966734 n=1 Tax=Erythranthe guttata TaxID=4155 RepID=UPI00064DA99F|nr:PREDICTED: uncharacterized protein LOC105966734 [Erythranthe guttata]|eukprot:XP_012846772.1 PREDICTED: uncharacterized protein LOC105966734 [Erythranthe guttata]